MIEILTWVSIFSGGLLIIMLLLSLIGGLDFDFDVDTDVADVDTDAGGLGILKGGLTFISVSSWVIKLLMASGSHPAIASGIGIFSGLLAFALLSYLLKAILKQGVNVNWKMEDALMQRGEVYLRIPGHEESGIVHIMVNGAIREVKAKSVDRNEIKTGETVVVMMTEGEYLLVRPEKESI